MINLHVLIPSHNRQHLFDNIDIRYKDVDINITIIDSSINKYKKSLKNCNYVHIPNKNFSSKILLGLKLIKEANVLLVPDDDHLIYENCKILYNNHKKYNSLLTVGNILSAKGYDYDKIYTIKKAPIEINKSEQIDLFIKFYQILWSLYNKEHLTNVMQVIDKCKFKNDNYIELTIAIITTYNEKKINFVNIDYLVRSTDNKSWGNHHRSIDIYESIKTVKDITKIIKYSDVEPEYILKCLLLYISTSSKRNQFNKYIKKFIPNMFIYYIKRMSYVIHK